MGEVVIDTNVLAVAENRHPDVSIECVRACTQRLLAIQNAETVVVDDEYRILREYTLNAKPMPGMQPGAGAKFVKWLLNAQRVVRVAITDAPGECFAEFPDAALQLMFDSSDRKFVAVANAHPVKPPILQATDSKWLVWKDQLAAVGIAVEFLCPDDICRFFRAKFPGKKLPVMP